MIVANEQGISTQNAHGMQKNARKPANKKLTGWVWKIPVKTALPNGLKVIEDPNSKGYYFICAAQNMPLQQFVGLLNEVALKCIKAYSIPKKKVG